MVSVLHLIDHMLNHYLEENIKKQMKHTFHFFSILIERKEMEKRTINHIKGKNYFNKKKNNKL